MIKSFFFTKKWRLWAWGGFVFINMDDNAQSLFDFLDPLPEHHKRWNLENCKKVIHVSKVVPGNWKTVFNQVSTFIRQTYFL